MRSSLPDACNQPPAELFASQSGAHAAIAEGSLPSGKIQCQSVMRLCRTPVRIRNLASDGAARAIESYERGVPCTPACIQRALRARECLSSHQPGGEGTAERCENDAWRITHVSLVPDVKLCGDPPAPVLTNQTKLEPGGTLHERAGPYALGVTIFSAPGPA
jgi:hypothetical protein